MSLSNLKSIKTCLAASIVLAFILTDKSQAATECDEAKLTKTKEGLILERSGTRTVTFAPDIARLQQGRKHLLPQEKIELKKYGMTGLELMTYAHCNRTAGKDVGCVCRSIYVHGKGRYKVQEKLTQVRYCYPDYRSRLTLDGIKPGDIESELMVYILYPPREEGTTVFGKNYLTSKDNFSKYQDLWARPKLLRRIRAVSQPSRDQVIKDLNVTQDDRTFRQPWEQLHTIIGEDTIDEKQCLVVQSVHLRDPDYYLSKRVVWVDRNRFLEIHEEQFDKTGKLYKIFNRSWKRIPQCPYYLWYFLDVRDLSEGTRSIEIMTDFIVDQGIGPGVLETEFRMESDRPWRQFKTPPPFKGLSELPPPPEVRWIFWEQKEDKPVIAGE